jgi:hypothetical protein
VSGFAGLVSVCPEMAFLLWAGRDVRGILGRRFAVGPVVGGLVAG